MFGALFSTNDEFQISMRMSSGTDKLQYVNSLLVNMYLSSTEIIRTGLYSIQHVTLKTAWSITYPVSYQQACEPNVLYCFVSLT